MVKRKQSRRKARPLAKRVGEEPIKATKAEFKKLGPIGKFAVGIFIASALSPIWAREINKLPVVGKWTKPITGFARGLRGRMR